MTFKGFQFNFLGHVPENEYENVRKFKNLNLKSFQNLPRRDPSKTYAREVVLFQKGPIQAGTMVLSILELILKVRRIKLEQFMTSLYIFFIEYEVPK